MTIKKYLLIILLSTCMVNLTYARKKTAIIKAEFDVDKFMSQMTLEEKVGQMTQLDVSYMFKDGKFMESRFDSIVRIVNIGSILGHGNNRFTATEWQALITKVQNKALESRLKIPILYGVDAIHGATFTKNATLYPHNIGIAASRNPQLAYQVARNTSNEVMASGIRWVFDPVLDVVRNPLWPRTEETFGESTLLATKFGEQAILGYEKGNGDDTLRVASCMKHFLGYGSTIVGKDRTPAVIADNYLYEYILPPFEQAIKAGSQTIMINSGCINGIPVHANKAILTTLLKEKLNFKGFLVTDWLDIKYLYNSHFVAKNNKEAVALAINAGIDMSMVPEDMDFYYDLIELVKEGVVPMSRIDDAVRRILTVKKNVGLFNDPMPRKEDLKMFGLKKYSEQALNMAQESLTLLKNDSLNKKAVLPLPKTAKVLVTGPTANALSALHGCWSFSWQGDVESYYPATNSSISDAIQSKIGTKNTIVVADTIFHEISDKYIDEALKAAQSVDYIVVCLGEKSYAEGAGNIDDLTLPKDQLKLVTALSKLSKPIVLVLAEGRARIISSIEPFCKAVLLAYRPGSEGGKAIANVLFGDYNPSGILPFTYPRDVNNLVLYDAPARIQRQYKPQWPFGFGLSYSNFSFGSIVLNKDVITGDENLIVKIDIKNTSARDGSIAVDLFLRDVVASSVPAMQKLIAFDKVFIPAGETKQVLFNINRKDLAFVNSKTEWITESGEFILTIGNKKKSFTYNISK